MPKSGVKQKKTKTKKESACQIDIYNSEGKKSGVLDLPEKIFASKVSINLLAQAVRVYLANQRQGNQKTKTRGEVNFSKAKIYRQKGTGRARHGARSAPIFVGGGIAHGPGPRDFSLTLPKKMRRAALFAALSDKFIRKNIIAMEGLDKIEAKTSYFAKILESLKPALKTENLRKKALKMLIVLPEKMKNLERAARNIEGITLMEARLLNAYNVLAHEKIILLKESAHVLERTFSEVRQEKKINDEKTK